MSAADEHSNLMQWPTCTLNKIQMEKTNNPGQTHAVEKIWSNARSGHFRGYSSPSSYGKDVVEAFSMDLEGPSKKIIHSSRSMILSRNLDSMERLENVSLGSTD
ncbi:hypothetical protein KIN20_003600 [Parelaphostrongylus tenuis]|uniref:Uncharacterized protein n=1 Tax=Parelaphostrongylus tenuis TaxID=148309 RepID=A0AAD5MFX6_PARTN|nr:hypothetical protein KIN20_003600 [Parelaphostrongylus tenuis]